MPISNDPAATRWSLGLNHIDSSARPGRAEVWPSAPSASVEALSLAASPDEAISRLLPWHVNLRQLAMLAAVVDRGGYLAAGKHLHVAHSAVHRQVRQLEDAVGTKVLVRTGRGMQLTEIGSLLVDLTRRVDAEMVSVKTAVDNIRRRRLGTVRIGAGTATPIFFLPQVVAELRARLPGLALQIITRPAAAVIEMLRDHSVDIGIVDASSETSDAPLRSHRVYREEFALAVAPEHPLAGVQSPQGSQLRELPIVSFPRCARASEVPERRLRAGGEDLQISMEIEDEATIVKMVELGVGAGLLPWRCCTSRRLHIVPTCPDRLLLDVVAAFDAENISTHAQMVLETCVRHASRSCDPHPVIVSR